MQKYAALHTISLVLRGIGWLLIVLAIIFFIIGIASLSQNNGPVDSGLGALKIIGAISFLGMGVLTLAFGELIQVFVDIADNTRAAVILLKNPRADLGDIVDRGPDQKQAQAHQYDKTKWNALVEFDPELARVEAILRPYGQKYVDQLATAYLILNDRNKLPEIIKKIVEAAKRDATEAKDAKHEARSIPPGFVQVEHKKLSAGQVIFDPVDGEGVVIGPGRNRYFVRARYTETNVENEREAFGLYYKA
jgi:hypothetical protein